MERILGRRAFVRELVAGAAATAEFATRREGRKSGVTFTYKTVGDCAIKADVFRASTRETLPVAVWIHGGALIMGDRHGIDATLRDTLVSAGYAVVSIDYRLAPETKLTGILEDVRDGFAWIRSEGAKEFGARTDPIAVLGGSAGGYLTLCTGFVVEPRPVALVSFWGYGDIAGDWYARPDEFYRRQPLVTETEARAAVGTTVIAEPAAGNRRGRFYLFAGRMASGPARSPVPTRPPRKRARPVLPAQECVAQVSAHDADPRHEDTDVPYEQSVLIDQALARQGVPHEFVSVPDGGHGLGNIGRDMVAGIYRKAVAFIGRYHA